MWWRGQSAGLAPRAERRSSLEKKKSWFSCTDMRPLTNEGEREKRKREAGGGGGRWGAGGVERLVQKECAFAGGGVKR